jgi:hypothetical protein
MSEVGYIVKYAHESCPRITKGRKSAVYGPPGRGSTDAATEGSRDRSPAKQAPAGKCKLSRFPNGSMTNPTFIATQHAVRCFCRGAMFLALLAGRGRLFWFRPAVSAVVNDELSPAVTRSVIILNQPSKRFRPQCGAMKTHVIYWVSMVNG